MPFLLDNVTAVLVGSVLLLSLFAVQQRGTAGIARVFSPVMVVWFSVLGVLGARQIAAHPAVLRAISPTYALELAVDRPWRAFLAVGSIFLVVLVARLVGTLGMERPQRATQPEGSSTAEHQRDTD